jgi:hypothetical protein
VWRAADRVDRGLIDRNSGAEEFFEVVGGQVFGLEGMPVLLIHHLIPKFPHPGDGRWEDVAMCGEAAVA